jgi:HlyD family type I secretion membrane fusion protein
MSLHSFLGKLFRRGDSANKDAESFDSPTAEVLAQADASADRGTLWVVSLMFVSAIVFISVVKIDKVVTGAGRLVPVHGAITVQPLETQIISRILVAVGDVVKKGQVLAVCDPTFTQANRAQLEEDVANYDAQVRRMEAEETGRPFVSQAGKSYDALQAQIFVQRQTEFRSGVAVFDQNIQSDEAKVAGLQKDVTEYSSRLKIMTDLEAMQSKLAKDGFASQSQWLNAQDNMIEMGRLLSDARNNLDATRHELDSLKEQRHVFIEKWRDDNLHQLVAARNSLETAREGLTKASKLNELVNLAAPVDGVVTRIPVLQTSSVASGAVPLFNLVPIDAPLEVDVQIDSQDIGFIKVGDRANIKFDTFEFLEHGIGIGEVKAISQDAFTDINTQDTQTPEGGATQAHTGYYDTRIKILELQLHDVPPSARLIAGMTLQADIIVGKRTILWYLLGGALRTGAQAMREPS